LLHLPVDYTQLLVKPVALILIFLQLQIQLKIQIEKYKEKNTIENLLKISINNKVVNSRTLIFVFLVYEAPRSAVLIVP